MKAIAKPVAKIVVFILVLIAVIIPIQNEFVPYQFQDTMQAGTFYNYTEDNSVDILISGTSSIMVGLSPLRIYEKAKITSHVRGNSMQPPQVLYLDVKEALKTQNPKLVVCSAAMLLKDFDIDKNEVRVRRGMDYMPLTFDKLEVAKAITNKSEWQTMTSFILPLVRYHDCWKEIKSENGLQVGDRNDYDYKHGQWAVYKTEPQVDNLKENMNDNTEVRVAQSSLIWYERIAKLCKEKKIELLFVTTPDQRWTMGKYECIAQVAHELDAGYLDYNVKGITSECGLDWQKDFYDNHHVNARGAMKITDYFVAYVQQQYALEASEVSDTVKKQFEKDIVHYNKTLKEKGYN